MDLDTAVSQLQGQLQQLQISSGEAVAKQDWLDWLEQFPVYYQVYISNQSSDMMDHYEESPIRTVEWCMLREEDKKAILDRELDAYMRNEDGFRDQYVYCSTTKVNIYDEGTNEHEANASSV